MAELNAETIKKYVQDFNRYGILHVKTDEGKEFYIPTLLVVLAVILFIFIWRSRRSREA